MYLSCATHTIGFFTIQPYSYCFQFSKIILLCTIPGTLSTEVPTVTSELNHVTSTPLLLSACKQCPPGFGVKEVCDGVSDTVCEKCPTGKNCSPPPAPTITHTMCTHTSVYSVDKNILH